MQVRLDEYGFSLEALLPGQMMSEQYIRMQTMIHICTAAPNAAIPDLITVLAK